MKRRDFLRTTGALAGLALWPGQSAGMSPAAAQDARLLKIALTPGSIGVSVGSQLELNALAHRHRYDAVEPRAAELAGLSATEIDELLADLADRALDALIGREPALATRAVPIGRLLGRELGGGLHASAAALATTSSRGM